MRISWASMAGGALVALAPLAWANPLLDSDEVRALLKTRSFTAQQTQAMLALLDGAERRGLPMQELVGRIREGIARRADARAILGVVQDRARQLERADDIVRRCAREGIAVRNRERALMRLADALAQGVAPGDITTLLPAVRGRGDIEGVARAAEVMGRLDRKGFPPDETREVVAAALAEAWPGERMDELVGLFLQADYLHVPPDDAARLLSEGIREKAQPPGLLRKMDDAAHEYRGLGRQKGRPAGRGKGGAKKDSKPDRDGDDEEEDED